MCLKIADPFSHASREIILTSFRSSIRKIKRKASRQTPKKPPPSRPLGHVFRNWPKGFSTRLSGGVFAFPTHNDDEELDPIYRCVNRSGELWSKTEVCFVFFFSAPTISRDSTLAWTQIMHQQSRASAIPVRLPSYNVQIGKTLVHSIQETLYTSNQRRMRRMLLTNDLEDSPVHFMLLRDILGTT
jgi:hypothetical protein